MQNTTTGPSRYLIAGLLLIQASIALSQTSPPTQTMGSKVGVFRYGSQWILNQEGNGQYQTGVDHVFNYGGLPGDYPVTGDWNASGSFNVGIYRSSTQFFLLDTNGDAWVDAGDQYFNLSIAQSTDIPVTGDWNGDHRTKVGLFRPSTCEWFLDYDGNGVWNPSTDKHYQPTNCQPGDVPVVGNWSIYGESGYVNQSYIGVYRSGTWLLDTIGRGNNYDTTISYGYFGSVPDVPVVGQWYSPSTPDLLDQLGVVQGDYQWILDANGDEQWDSGDIVVAYGSGTGSDVPVVGNWTQNIPPVNATPDTFNVTVSGTNQGSNGSAPVGTTAQFSFTFHDPVYGGSAILGGYLMFNPYIGSGHYCQVSWVGSFAVLADTYTQSDSYCTISQPAVTYSSTDPSLATFTLNISYNTVAIGSYTVNSVVYDQAGNESPWGQVGTFTVAGALTTAASPPSPSVGLLNVAGNSVIFSVQGGTPPYNWVVQTGNGSLPPGHSLAMGSQGTTAAVSGTPSQTGTFTFTLAATDSTNLTGTIDQTMVIVDMTSIAGSAPTGTQGKEYIRLANRLIAVENAAPLAPMTGTKVGVFRRGAVANEQACTSFNSAALFWEDTNGTAVFQTPDAFCTTIGGCQQGDIPVVGDWNGTGHALAGIFRNQNRQVAGQWYLEDPIASNGYDYFQFGGIAGEVPVVGDWAQTGKDCVGVFRNGFQWVLDASCTRGFDFSPAVFSFGGIAGDVPVAGKWTGQGTRAGLVRLYAPGGVPQGVPFFWVMDSLSATTGNANTTHPAAVGPFALGGLTCTQLFPGCASVNANTTPDMYLAGDWLNTGTSYAGIYRAGTWLLDAAPSGSPQASHTFGLDVNFGGLCSGNANLQDLPVPGKW